MAVSQGNFEQYAGALQRQQMAQPQGGLGAGLGGALWGGNAGGYVTDTVDDVWSGTTTATATNNMNWIHGSSMAIDPTPKKRLFHRINDEAFDVKEPLDELRLKVARWLE